MTRQSSHKDRRAATRERRLLETNALDARMDFANEASATLQAGNFERR